MFWKSTGREPLCATCAWSHIARGYGEGEERVFCRFGGGFRPLEFAVRECTDYTPREETSAGGRAGFVMPQDVGLTLSAVVLERMRRRAAGKTVEEEEVSA